MRNHDSPKMAERKDQVAADVAGGIQGKQFVLGHTIWCSPLARTSPAPLHLPSPDAADSGERWPVGTGLPGPVAPAGVLSFPTQSMDPGSIHLGGMVRRVMKMDQGMAGQPSVMLGLMSGQVIKVGPNRDSSVL